MMRSAGMGIGTPIDLISIRIKIAARPYYARNISILFMINTFLLEILPLRFTDPSLRRSFALLRMTML